MLKQMLSDDRNEAVREAVTKSLALVVAFLENVDKYEQVRLLGYFQRFEMKAFSELHITLCSVKTTAYRNYDMQSFLHCI